MKRFHRNTSLLLLWLCLLVACGTPKSTGSASRAAPTPTVSPLFDAAASVATAVPAPSPTDRPGSAALVALPTPDNRIEDAIIYSDTLDAGWELGQSWATTVDPDETAYIRSGKKSLAVTPTDNYGGLFFTLRQGTTPYERERVLGLSFWLNAGDGEIETGDLAVTVLGSNAYPYWVENDQSVAPAGRVTDDSPLFSETRLYYLGINRTIPPDTWVEVILWLDERQLDPDYTYVTGFYIKNSEEFRQTFYVDDVHILLMRPF